MQKLEKPIRSHPQTQPKKVRAAMPAIIRNVPPGHHWGWYSREDPRMHLQSVDRQHRHKVWLEDKGKRVFEPEGKIPARVLKSLREAVSEERQRIEDNWVDLMLDLGWLVMHVNLPNVNLVAYGNTPNKFTRKIDLSDWLEPEQIAILTPEIITLDREMAALRLWATRTGIRVPYDVRLSTLLWKD